MAITKLTVKGRYIMRDFLAFRTMLTPIIIQIIFWIGVVVCVMVGFVFIFGQLGGEFSTIKGFLIILLGPIGVRIYCELLIIFFRMNETLTEIKHVLDTRSADQH